MVRLKAYLWQGGVYMKIFQFLYGAIKSANVQDCYVTNN